MAIPWVLSPIVIDDRLLTDGGAVRNLPAQDAREMGADVVIGVDVGPKVRTRKQLETMFDVLRQTSLLDLQKETEVQYGYCDVIVEPDLTTITVADFGEAREAIARGEAAARAMLPTLQALADSLNPLIGPREKIVRKDVDSFQIERMTVTGLDRVSRRMVDTDMDIRLPATVDLEKIETGIDYVYGSGFFDRVNYRITDDPGGATLRVQVVENSQNLFRVGVRYDTRTEASLLLDVTFRNLLTRGSTLALDLRLAKDLEAEIRHTIHLGILRSLGLLTRVNGSRASTNLFENDVQVAEYRSTYAFGELALGTIFATTAAFAGGLRVEYIDSEPAIGAPGFGQQITRGMPVMLGLIVDSTNETIYPTSGAQIDMRFEHAFADIGNTGSFSRVYLDAGLILPRRSRVGMLTDVYFGASDGDMPVVYEFAMGGIHAPWTFLGFDNSFMGVKAQQRVGPFIQAANLGLQYRLSGAVVTQLLWSIGNTFNDSDIKLEMNRYINGVGLMLGARILKGRAEVTFSTSEIEDFITHVTIGSAF
jgi:NTE family protein